MVKKKSNAPRAPRPSEAESYPRLPPFGAEFSLGPATRSYRSPMVTAASSGMVVPSYGHDAGEMDDMAEMGGEAADHPDEADLPDEFAAEEDSTEEDNDVEVEASDLEVKGNDENGET